MASGNKAYLVINHIGLSNLSMVGADLLVLAPDDTFVSSSNFSVPIHYGDSNEKVREALVNYVHLNFGADVDVNFITG